MVSMAAMSRVKYAFDDAEMDALTEYEHLHGDEQLMIADFDAPPAFGGVGWARLGKTPVWSPQASSSTCTDSPSSGSASAEFPSPPACATPRAARLPATAPAAHPASPRPPALPVLPAASPARQSSAASAAAPAAGHGGGALPTAQPTRLRLRGKQPPPSGSAYVGGAVIERQDEHDGELGEDDAEGRGR